MSENIVIATKKEFFTWLPNCIVYEWGLSAEALGVALYLNGKPAGWQTRPFDVQNHFKFGDSKWRRLSKELKGFGLLVEEITAEGTKLWFTLPDIGGCAPKKPTVENRGPRKADRGFSTPLSNKDITNKDLLTNKDLCATEDKKPKIDIEPVFDEMWKQYPVKKGKQMASKAFKKIFDTKGAIPHNERLESVWMGFKAHLAEHQTKQQLKAQGADIWVPELPHLSTWLNQCRWEDGYQKPEDILRKATRKSSGLDLSAIESQWK